MNEAAVISADVFLMKGFVSCITCRIQLRAQGLWVSISSGQEPDLLLNHDGLLLIHQVQFELTLPIPFVIFLYVFHDDGAVERIRVARLGVVLDLGEAGTRDEVVWPSGELAAKLSNENKFPQ